MTVQLDHPHPQTISEAAALAAVAADGTADSLFWHGVVTGFIAAAVDDGDGSERFPFVAAEVERFRTMTAAEWLAQPVSSPGMAANLAGFANRNRPATIAVSGMLHGYATGTAHRADAATCTGCDRRILTTVHTDWRDCPEHGTVHDACADVLCTRLCHRWDDL